MADSELILKLETALMEAEDRFHHFIDDSIQGFLIHQNLKPIFVNNTCARIFGYTQEEMLSLDTIGPLIHPQELDRLYGYMRSRLNGNSAPMQYEFRGKRKGGAEIWLDNRVRMITWKGENAILLTIFDITQRKAFEQELEESKERFRVLHEASFGGIGIHDQGVILDANQGLCRTTGYDLSELVGMNGLLLIAPDWREYVMEKIVSDYEKPYEVEGQRKNGSIYPLEIQGKVIPYKGRKVRVTEFRDITDRKHSELEKEALEKQLQQAQKMEAIGTLAGGIAHDFNNLLMGIQGRVSLMIMEMEDSHPHYHHLVEMEEYVRSAATLTEQLLGFARGGKYEVVPANINLIIQRQNNMFGRTKKEIVIHEDFQTDLWTAEVDQKQIDQVLLNLYVNAWQAMPEGGHLFVKTKNRVLKVENIQPFSLAPGKYIEIEVTDTGTGIDDNYKDRIFDPFFTTKEMGRGTGLGLASSYGIIKNHGGFIKVESKKGRGSTFRIYLPATTRKTVEEKSRAPQLLRGQETILVIDDEELILNVSNGLLESLGYRVLSAKGGKAGIDLYASQSDRIHMVVLDLIMPDLSGKDTYLALKKVNSNIKVLLSSGYSLDGQAAEILSLGCNGFIQKPFNVMTLSQKIREILDK